MRALERAVLIRDIRYRAKKRKHDDGELTTVEFADTCQVPLKRTIAPMSSNETNANSNYMHVPENNVISVGVGCMFASVQMLFRVSDRKEEYPGLYIQRVCNASKGLSSFRQLLFMTMDFAKRRDAWPVDDSGEEIDLSWLQNFEHFKVVTGEIGLHVPPLT